MFKVCLIKLDLVGIGGFEVRMLFEIPADVHRRISLRNDITQIISGKAIVKLQIQLQSFPE